MCLEVLVKIKSDFPLSLPYIYLAEEDVAKLGFLPNIDTNGLICTFDRITSIPNPKEPEQLVEVCVRKAKSIIEDGLSSDDLEKYDREFLAYWESKYPDETDVDTQVLSLISEAGNLPNWVVYVLLRQPIGRIHAFLYSDPLQFQVIASYLGRQNIAYREIPTFYLGQLKDLCPPFCLRNGDVVDITESMGLSNEFRDYLKSEPPLPVVTFSRIVDGRNLILGWHHDPVELRSRRRGKKIVKIPKALSPRQYPRLLASQNRSRLVRRFSPQVFTCDRLALC